MQLGQSDAKLVAAALRRIDMKSAQCALLIAPYKSYNPAQAGDPEQIELIPQQQTTPRQSTIRRAQ
jgi:hypothetical protein